MYNKKTSFTLIELLVVVAIIAVLVAVLLPALHNARQIAKRVACGHNLKQCGVILYSYSVENNSRVPPALNISAFMPSIFYVHSGSLLYDLPKMFKDSGCGAIIKVLMCPNCPVYPIDEKDSRYNLGLHDYMTYSYFPGRTRPTFDLPSVDVPTEISKLGSQKWVMMQDNCLKDQFDLYRFNHPTRSAIWSPFEPKSAGGWYLSDEFNTGANLLFGDGSVGYYTDATLDDVGIAPPGLLYFSKFPLY